MIIQKELANNPFGHGDLHALPIQVYSKLTQGHFLQTFTSFRKCHFEDHVCLDKSFLGSTAFALAFFEL